MKLNTIATAWSFSGTARPCGYGRATARTGAYPRIVEAALRHRPDSFVLDGDAVVLGVDRIANSMASTAASMTTRSNSTRPTS
jgi:hypothetical protein